MKCIQQSCNGHGISFFLLGQHNFHHSVQLIFFERKGDGRASSEYLMKQLTDILTQYS